LFLSNFFLSLAKSRYILLIFLPDALHSSLIVGYGGGGSGFGFDPPILYLFYIFNL